MDKRLAGVLFMVAALAFAASSAFVSSHAATAGQLPGQQTWGNGVSSYIFGTNDTINYGSPNVDSLASVQSDLKQGGLTLMRSWAYDSPAGVEDYSDSDILNRVQSLKNAGMQCMFMLGSVDNLTWLEHVVTLLGSSCNIYEFGNENDNTGVGGVGIATDVSDWNAAIPKLRAINPNAVFGGPAVMYPTSNDGSASGYSNDISYFLAKTAASGVRADFISYHDYPCNGYTDQAAGLTHTPQAFAGDQSEVLSWEQQYYGATVPTGITEYNFDPGTSTLGKWADDSNFMFQWTEAAINAFIANHFDFATEFTSLNYSGYGALDMFDDSSYAPKAQFYAVVDMGERNGGPSTLPIPSAYPAPPPPPIATPTSSPSSPAAPTPTPAKTASPLPSPTSSPAPTASPRSSPTSSPTPTTSPLPSATSSPAPTTSPRPSPTSSPTTAPTSQPTPNVVPTAPATPTPLISPSPPPSPTPVSQPTPIVAPTPAPPATPTSSWLLGTRSVPAQIDSNAPGTAEAYSYQAQKSGKVGHLSLYLDSSSTASKVVVGLYADEWGRPGRLLTSGVLAVPAAGAWNTVAVKTATVHAGSVYWLAILQPAGTSGGIEYRDTNGRGRAAPTSSSAALGSLPRAWRTGRLWPAGPASAYASR